MFVIQVGASRKNDLESTSWTDGSLISSDSFGLNNSYSAAEGRKSELRHLTTCCLTLTKFATCRFPWSPTVLCRQVHGQLASRNVPKCEAGYHVHRTVATMAALGAKIPASALTALSWYPCPGLWLRETWFHVNVCRQHAQAVTTWLCHLSLQQRILASFECLVLAEMPICQHRASCIAKNGQSWNQCSLKYDQHFWLAKAIWLSCIQAWGRGFWGTQLFWSS